MTTVPDMSPRSAFRDGVVAVAPIVVGIVPFGLIAGFAAIEAGYGLAEAMGFSVVLFAGASQLAALELLGSGASVSVAVLTACVVNLRMAMYSASVAVFLGDESFGRRVLGSYLLIDQAYLVSVDRHTRTPSAPHLWWFYLGSASALWVVWQPATAIGALIGDTIPASIPLGFAVPLAFVSLLVPAVTSRPTLVAALTAAVVAVAAAPLPANAGMPIAMVAGIGAGWLAATRAQRRKER